MFQYFYFFVGIRFLLGKTTDIFNKLMSYLSTIGIVFGITSLIIVISIMNGFEKNLEKNTLSFIPHIMISDKNNLIKKTANIKNQLFFSEIISVNSIIMEDVVVQSYKNISVATILGLDTKEKDPLDNYFIDVKKTDLLKNNLNLIIGENLANYLNVKKGDTIRLLFPSYNIVTMIGQIPLQCLFKIVGTFFTNSEIDNYQILINQEDAAKIMQYPSNYITYWRLYLKDPLNINYLLKLKKYVIKKNLSWKDWRNDRGDLFQAVKIEKNTMVMLISLTILIAIFNMLTLTILLIIDKKEEIAILQTQGASKKQIMMIFISQSFISGIIGIFFGNLLAILITKNIKYFIPFINKLFYSFEIPIIINPIQIIIINVITILLLLIFTIYPAWLSTKSKPIKILSYE